MKDAIGLDLYNQTMTGGVAKTLNNRATDSDHIPCVIVSAGFKGGAGAMAGGIGYEEEIAPTIASADSGSNRTPCVLVYESHGQDCRYKPLGDVCSTVSQKYGTGGG